MLEDLVDLEQLLENCASFITVRQGIVYFLHLSAKEYPSTRTAANVLAADRYLEHGHFVTSSLQTMREVLKRNLGDLKGLGELRSEVNIYFN